MLLVVFQWTWNDLEQVDSVHKKTVSKQTRSTTVRQEVVLKPGKIKLHFFINTAIAKAALVIEEHFCTKHQDGYHRSIGGWPTFSAGTGAPPRTTVILSTHVQRKRRGPCGWRVSQTLYIQQRSNAVCGFRLCLAFAIPLQPEAAAATESRVDRRGALIADSPAGVLWLYASGGSWEMIDCGVGPRSYLEVEL